MKFLTTPAQLLQANTSSAANIQWTASYIDSNETTGAIPTTQSGKINAATTTQIVPPPAAGFQRQISDITILNVDPSLSVTVILQIFDGNNTWNQLAPVVLTPQQSLQYSDADGFQVFDSNGIVITDNAGGASETGVIVAGAYIGAEPNLNFVSGNTANLVISGAANSAVGNVTITLDTRIVGNGIGSSSSLNVSGNLMTGTVNVVGAGVATVTNTAIGTATITVTANASLTNQSNTQVATTFAANQASLIPVFVGGALVSTQRNVNFIAANTSNLSVTGTANVAGGNTTVAIDLKIPFSGNIVGGVSNVVVNGNTVTGSLNVAGVGAISVTNTSAANIAIAVATASNTGTAGVVKLDPSLTSTSNSNAATAYATSLAYALAQAASNVVASNSNIAFLNSSSVLVVSSVNVANTSSNISFVSLQPIYLNGVLVGSEQNLNIVVANTSNLSITGVDNSSSGNVTLTLDTRVPGGGGGGGSSSSLNVAGNVMTGTINVIGTGAVSVTNTGVTTATIAVASASNTGTAGVVKLDPSITSVSNTNAATAYAAGLAYATAQAAYNQANTISTNANVVFQNSATVNLQITTLGTQSNLSFLCVTPILVNGALIGAQQNVNIVAANSSNLSITGANNPATGNVTVTVDTVNPGGGGGGGSPGGANTNIQFNDGGLQAGDANLSWDKVNNQIIVTGNTYASATRQARICLWDLGQSALSANTGRWVDGIFENLKYFSTQPDNESIGNNYFVIARSATNPLANITYGNSNDLPLHIFEGDIAAPTTNQSNNQTQVKTGLAAFKSSSSACTSSTALTADAALTVSFNEAGNYTFEIFLPFYETASGTGGFQFDLNTGSASLTNLVYTVSGFATTAVGPQLANTSAVTVWGVSTISTVAATPSWMLAKGFVTVTAAGTQGVRWSQKVSNGSPTNLLAGASFVVEKIG